MEEKILILRLLEEGKITKEEAFSLLEALNDNLCNGKHKRKKDDFSFEDDLNKFAKSVEKFAEEVNSKVSTTFKEIEPKVKKNTQNILNKTSELLSNLSKNFDNTNEECCDDEVFEDDEDNK